MTEDYIAELDAHEFDTSTNAVGDGVDPLIELEAQLIGARNAYKQLEIEKQHIARQRDLLGENLRLQIERRIGYQVAMGMVRIHDAMTVFRAELAPIDQLLKQG